MHNLKDLVDDCEHIEQTEMPPKNNNDDDDSNNNKKQRKTSLRNLKTTTKKGRSQNKPHRAKSQLI